VAPPWRRATLGVRTPSSILGIEPSALEPGFAFLPVTHQPRACRCQVLVKVFPACPAGCQSITKRDGQTDQFIQVMEFLMQSNPYQSTPGQRLAWLRRMVWLLAGLCAAAQPSWAQVK
jgi:hypothetical protein